MVWPQLSPGKVTKLLKLRMKKQSKKKKKIQPLPLLVSRVGTSVLAFLVLLTDFSKIWAKLRCYKNITSETQLSSLLQGNIQASNILKEEVSFQWDPSPLARPLLLCRCWEPFLPLLPPKHHSPPSKQMEIKVSFFKI